MEFRTEIINNVIYVFYAWLIFALCVVANVISKTYYNTHNMKQLFNAKKWWNGLRKMGSIGLSTALLSVVASSLPYIPVVDNIISSEYKDSISILTIFSLYAYLIAKYFIEATKTNLHIAQNNNIVEDCEGDINGN